MAKERQGSKKLWGRESTNGILSTLFALWLDYFCSIWWIASGVLSPCPKIEPHRKDGQYNKMYNQPKWIDSWFTNLLFSRLKGDQ